VKWGIFVEPFTSLKFSELILNCVFKLLWKPEKTNKNNNNKKPHKLPK
jgi:hypothetical protein